MPVIVPRTHQQDYIRPQSSSRIIPSLDVKLDYRLHVYNHENLITATRSVLNHDNQQWIVDVYLTDNKEGEFSQPKYSNMPTNYFLASPDNHRNKAEALHHKFVQSLKERYLNNNRPPDRLIYKCINLYKDHLNTPRDLLVTKNQQAMLEAVIGSKKRKYLRLFFKYKTLHQKLNSLLVIPGFQEDIQIRLLHKITAIYYDEISLIEYPNPIKFISANFITNTANRILLGIDLQHFFNISQRKR